MKLDIDHVSVEIQGKRIVEEVSMLGLPNRVVGLIGPNGSGKSTLLRTIYRVLKPSGGKVLLGGEDIWKLKARESARRTGVVVQESPTDFPFTVREVVIMGRTPHKSAFESDTQADLELVDNALARVEMQPFTERLFATLSGGEKQRVLIARVLAQQPKLLVLDEPTNHLDIHHQLDILELVRKLDITTLVTLHDLNLAATYCDYLYVLSEGKIVAQGEPETTLTRDIIRRVFRVDAIHSHHPITGCLSLAFMPLAPEGA